MVINAAKSARRNPSFFSVGQQSLDYIAIPHDSIINRSHGRSQKSTSVYTNIRTYIISRYAHTLSYIIARDTGICKILSRAIIYVRVRGCLRVDDWLQKYESTVLIYIIILYRAVARDLNSHAEIAARGEGTAYSRQGRFIRNKISRFKR